MSNPLYSELVLQHAANPRNLGDLAGATATVSATNPVCGDEMTLAVRMNDGHVAEAKFKARGCKAAVASASLLTEMMVGKTLAELREITAEQISQALGGLPSATRHGSQLAEDALDAILERLG